MLYPHSWILYLISLLFSIVCFPLYSYFFDFQQKRRQKHGSILFKDVWLMAFSNAHASLEVGYVHLVCVTGSQIAPKTQICSSVYFSLRFIMTSSQQQENDTPFSPEILLSILLILCYFHALYFDHIHFPLPSPSRFIPHLVPTQLCVVIFKNRPSSYSFHLHSLSCMVILCSVSEPTTEDTQLKEANQPSSGSYQLPIVPLLGLEICTYLHTPCWIAQLFFSYLGILPFLQLEVCLQLKFFKLFLHPLHGSWLLVLGSYTHIYLVICNLPLFLPHHFSSARFQSFPPFPLCILYCLSNLAASSSLHL